MATSKIRLLSAGWSARAEAALEGATGSNPSYTVQELKNEVQSGKTNLFEVVEVIEGKGRLMGYVCLWVENFGGGRELVLQAGAAMIGEKEALLKAMPAISEFGRMHGCESIRAHLDSKARVRMMKVAGFDVAETVMRRGL